MIKLNIDLILIKFSKKNKNILKKLKKYPDKKPYSFRSSESLMEKINIHCKHKNTTVPDLIAKLFEEEIKGLTLKRESTDMINFCALKVA